MSEPRVEEILRELRAKAPAAPEELRERVRAQTAREPAPRWVPRLRPALAVAASAVVALGVGAALIDAFTGSERSRPQQEATPEFSPALKSESAQPYRARDFAAPSATALPPARRLQEYDVAMRIRVRDRDDLSTATKRAMRDARRFGGYVVSVRYATPADGQGDASLVVRVPVRRVQEAIGRFSALGTIVSQRISLEDIQPQADRLAKSITARRTRIAELEAKRERAGLTPVEQAELAAARQDLARLTRSRASVVREGTYARVSLDLTTRRPAAQKQEPGRIGRALDDAGSILLDELVVLLYVLIVAGPLALLAWIALLGERARRRRANQTLLERAGEAG